MNPAKSVLQGCWLVWFGFLFLRLPHGLQVKLANTFSDSLQNSQHRNNYFTEKAVNLLGERQQKQRVKSSHWFKVGK